MFQRWMSLNAWIATVHICVLIILLLIQVSSKLSGTGSAHAHSASMSLQLQKTGGSGRKLSAVCDSVPVLLTACVSIYLSCHHELIKVKFRQHWQNWIWTCKYWPCRYYTITCAQLNIVLASIGLPKSTTCVPAIGDEIFIASVQVCTG